MKLQAKNYSTRSELENKVRNSLGLTPEPKAATIEGTREELDRLSLSDCTIFWGIKCIITDTPTETKPQTELVNRGTQHKFGINLEKNG